MKTVYCSYCGGRAFRRRAAEFWEVWSTPVPDGGGRFAKAVRETWPQTMVQRCLWHAFSQVNRHMTSRPRLRAGIELRGWPSTLCTLRPCGRPGSGGRLLGRYID